MAVLFKSITIKTNQARYLPEINNVEIDVHCKCFDHKNYGF